MTVVGLTFLAFLSLLTFIIIGLLIKIYSEEETPEFKPKSTIFYTNDVGVAFDDFVDEDSDPSKPFN